MIKELQSTSVSPDKIPGLIPFKKIAPKKTKVKHVTQVHGSCVLKKIVKSTSNESLRKRERRKNKEKYTGERGYKSSFPALQR